MANYETLELATTSDGVVTVTLNRPDARNAMNTQMMSDLRDCFAAFYVDPGAARCIVLTGAGDRAFCAGADLKERKGMTDETWRRQHAIVEQAIRAMMDCPVPMIAAVNGAAYAGGCELALSCDFLYASANARFAQTEVMLGIIPGAMGTQNLPRAIGLRRAKEVVLTGSPIDAQQALDWGLINRLYPTVEELRREALATAQRIAANAPIAVRQAKAALAKSADLDRANGYAYEIEAYNRTVGTEDRQEGILAFNEKRQPVFVGR
ncbi:MAG: enoyl-CoA hydratase-related protein [Pseudomonadota bacterium]